MCNQEFAKRLEIAIKKIGGVGLACSKAGVTYPTLTRWKEGTSDPKLSNIVAFTKAAGVSLDWLVHGTETGLANELVAETEDMHTYETLINEQTDYPEDEYDYIPAYDIEVSAGNGSVCLGEATATKHLAFRKQWLKARGLTAKSLAALFTKGDSMTPTIPESAVVVINREHTQPLDGKVYVIRIEDRHYVKRIQWLIGGGLRLISDNKFYDPLDITKADMQASDIEVCGQVIHASYDLPD